MKIDKEHTRVDDQQTEELKPDIKKNGHFFEQVAKGLESLKLLDYALLFIDNSPEQHYIDEEECFYLYQPGTTVELNNLKGAHERSDIYVLHCPNTILNAIRIKYREMKFQRTVRTPSLSYGYDKFTRVFLTNLKTMLSFEIVDKNSLVSYRIQEILSYLIENKGLTLLDFISNQQQFDTSKFKTFMECNVLANLTLTDLAFGCNMSVSKFKRIFKTIYNDTPINWFREQKIEVSCELLKNTSKSIVEISDFIGYQNPSSYIKVFRVKHGLTPNDYRQLHAYGLYKVGM